MNPDLLYKISEYQRQDRMQEARTEQLAMLTGQAPISVRMMVGLANGMITAGHRLQTFALGRATYHTL